MHILNERICLFENYSKKEVMLVRDFLQDKIGEFLPNMKFLLNFDRNKTVKDALAMCKDLDSVDEVEAVDGYKICIVCGYDTKTLFYIIKSIKQVLGHSDRFIFSQANHNSIEMKVKKIFEENIKDHEYIKKYGIKPIE